MWSAGDYLTRLEEQNRHLTKTNTALHHQLAEANKKLERALELAERAANAGLAATEDTTVMVDMFSKFTRNESFTAKEALRIAEIVAKVRRAD